MGEKQTLSNGKIIERPGIVHRIDRETSGVLVIAKDQKTFEFLKNQFKGRTIQKTYHALVWGSVKDEAGIIDRKIGRSRSDFRKWSADRGARGVLREAVTEYKVLKRLQTDSDGKLINSDIIADQKKISDISSFTFLEVKPKTGRTHQIRVHLRYLNHPVVCDALYAPKQICPIGSINRLALHASSIEFSLPDNSVIKAEAPLPLEFLSFVGE